MKSKFELESEPHSCKMVHTANTSQVATEDNNPFEEANLQEIKNTSQIEVAFGFNVGMSQIADLFEQVSTKLGYDMIEKQANHATAIKQSKKSVMQMLNCFNWWGQGNVTAIKMTVHTKQRQSKRVCRVRGLVGSRRDVKMFIDLVAAKSQELMNSKISFYGQQQSGALGDQLSNPFHLQTCAAYMFHKILSNSQYGIGNVLSGSIRNLKQTYKNLQQAANVLPAPMKTSLTLVNEVVENLYKEFNYGRKQMEQIMPYCRISVEKYVFEEVSGTLIPLYVHRAKEAEKTYLQKKQKIFQKLTLRQIFEEIHLAERYWSLIVMTDNLQEELRSTKSANQWRKMLKFAKAYHELEKMSYTKNPREKVKYCQLMYTSLKTTTYEVTKGKDELSNMEDIIPVMILAVLMVEVENLKSQVDMVVDFSAYDSCQNETESVGRMLVNISESINYVVRDWKV